MSPADGQGRQTLSFPAPRKGGRDSVKTAMFTLSLPPLVGAGSDAHNHVQVFCHLFSFHAHNVLRSTTGSNINNIRSKL